MEYVLAYLACGYATNFMRGYTAPIATGKASAGADWLRFIMWPLMAPSIVQSFGGAIRMGWKS